LDPAGRAIGESLRGMGFERVEDVRIGKVVDINAAGIGKEDVDAMCKKLLANPVIEDYEVEEVA
jgi:phosphoribosylformylglycinamidine synthase